MKALPPDLLAILQQPVLQDADLDTQATFFEREEVQSFYFDTLENPDKDDVLRASAGLLPGLHPHRAALLVLLCGALVENGADPRLLFDAAQGLMGRLLASLAPYCAMAPQEVEADEAQDEEELEALAAWQAANAAFEALAPQERFEVGARQAAVDLLVLPLMAMVVRNVHNHRALLADGALMSDIEDIYANDSLPFEQLHFLRGAAQLAYEDELVVLLPTSRAGMVVKAHGINNNFHAFSLLQDLMRAHAKTLGIRQSFAERPAANDEDEDDPRDSDAAEYLWLQATAFANGELVDGMAWSWGEGTLRENARRQGKLVLVAVETEDKPSRSWNGFSGVLHSEQKAHVSLARFLTPDEVAAYLA